MGVDTSFFCFFIGTASSSEDVGVILRFCWVGVFGASSSSEEESDELDDELDELLEDELFLRAIGACFFLSSDDDSSLLLSDDDELLDTSIFSTFLGSSFFGFGAFFSFSSSLSLLSLSLDDDDEEEEEDDDGDDDRHDHHDHDDADDSVPTKTGSGGRPFETLAEGRVRLHTLKDGRPFWGSYQAILIAALRPFRV